jgi:hypothetical protein
MLKLSGVAIVTAGLAGAGLLHVVWSWDTTALRAPNPGLALPEALSGLSSMIELHAGAWRSLPAPADPTPAPSSSEPPAHEIWQSAEVALSRATAIAPVDTTLGAGPVITLQPLPGTTFAAPVRPHPMPEPASLPPPAASPTPSPRERMSLAGPKEEVPRPHGRAAGPPPAVVGPAAAADEPPPAPKFGPEFFTRAEKIGGY